MAKRKRSSRPAEEPKGPNLDVGESMKRIRDYADVADSDDEFHLQRDEVSLGEAPDAKRRRKLQEQEEFLQASDEEVLDYSEAEDEEDEEAGDGGLHYEQDGLASGSDSESGGEEDDEEMAWGTTKADLYGADEIETEEQALEEAAEALRLQKKQLQTMSAADYGFDESEWQDTANGAVGDVDEKAVVTETLPQLHITEDMGPAERMKLLKSRYPEFEPLSKELLHMRDVHAALVEKVGSARNPAGFVQAPNAITKLRAASAYLGVLTMYFSLLTSPAWDGRGGVTALSATQLRDHPVMYSLVQCRDLWQKVQALPADVGIMPTEQHLEQDGVASGSGDTIKNAENTSKPKKSRAQRHAAAAEAAADARRVERLAKTEAGLAGLDDLVAPGAVRKSKSHREVAAAVDGGDSDIGEEAPLTAHEAAEKAKRKKSLRFYTSQIAQKANKRGASGRNAGGDEDVPHRERLRDRQARSNADAEKRGKKRVDAGAELGAESDEDDDRQAQQIRADGEEVDYYDLVAARTAKKKTDKTALAEAQKQAALQGGQVIQEETVGVDGKRKISYLIEKNKGLTPHRKKDVRNPRVKKRKKYDEKKKKLASMKAVYKGGEGRGGYGGELTGIKKGLVKSTKL
ncbi:hypothetical protein LTR36_000959 [Oleoguttula mirabilis]|uniref:Sas10 C-terminal domain-containing protein n=1 Tax=Oleoguttula mirabilis TaxID=1507867 RepID=A0AAV9JQ40_9PEZI|nr:hypothetical protein LTR36_000959 [Oleoguttula mirabilis]